MARRRQQVEIHGTDKSKGAFASLQNSARRTTRIFAGVGGALKGAFLPLVGAAGGVALLRQTASAMNELDLIGKKARTSGLSTDAFQALGVAAEEANVSAGLLNSSLLAFVKRVGEAKAGTGPLVSGLKTIDGELLNAITTAGNQEEALRRLVAGYQAADSATDKARITNAAFGRSGIEVGRVLEQLAGGFDEYTKRAKELGLVYDRDLIANQERLNNDLGIFNKVIGVQFKSILLTLAPIIVSIAKTTAEWAKALRALFDSVSSGAGKSLESVRKLLAEEKKTLQILESRKGSFFEPSPAQLQMTRARIAELQMLERAAIASSRHPVLTNSPIRPSNSGVAAIKSGTATVAAKSTGLQAARDQIVDLEQRMNAIIAAQDRGRDGAQQWGSALAIAFEQIAGGADDATRSVLQLLTQFSELARLASQGGGTATAPGGIDLFNGLGAIIRG